MKKVVLFLLMGLLLAGCAAEKTFETLSDSIPVLPVAEPQQFVVQMPDEAATPTFQNENGGELYVCTGYTISKQVLESGDLEKTVNALTGKSADELQIMESKQDAFDRYDFVWTAAGEDGLQLGRACILDDGNYHYALSTLAEETRAGELRETFFDMFASCTLLDPDINLRTGS